MKPSIFLRIKKFLTGGKLVLLEDFKKDRYVSIAYKDPFGYLWCHVYPLTKVGMCILLEDGTVDPHCRSSYVRRWIFIK